MKVLFKTKYGSQLYGTNTPTSDTDWKVIVIPPLQDLLVGKKLVTVGQSTGDDKSKNNADDEDISFIPLQIFAKDFFGGQTYAVEVAFAFLTSDQCTKNNPLTKFMVELTTQFLTSNIKAMVGYAFNQAQIYGVKGSRLASINKFSDFLDTWKDTGDAKLGDIVIDWLSKNSDKYLFLTTYENHGVMLPAVSLVEKIYTMDITVDIARSRINHLKQKYGNRAKMAEAASGADWKALSHALRITSQAITLLTNHKLVFPLNGSLVDLLLRIKQGEVPFDEVQTMLVRWMAALDTVMTTTTLPARTPELESQFNTWLDKQLVKFYNDDMKKLVHTGTKPRSKK